MSRIPTLTYGTPIPLAFSRVSFSGHEQTRTVPSDTQTEPPVKPDSRTKALGKKILRLGLNLFFVGSAVFSLFAFPILALHLPIMAAIAIPIGLGVVGHYLRKKFPDTTVLQPQQVQVFNQHAVEALKRGIAKGEKVFDWVTWLPGRKPYQLAGRGITRLVEKSLEFFASNLHKSMKNVEIPEGRWPRILYVSKVALVYGLDILSNKLGPFKFLANGLITLLQLQDIQSVMQDTETPPAQNEQANPDDGNAEAAKASASLA